VWKGDRVAACVAAASVVAKVTRDRIMVELDREFPEYGFATHKGYTTTDHSAALREYGPCVQHRFSYANVAGIGAGGSVEMAASRPRGSVGVAMSSDPAVTVVAGENGGMEGGAG
jgi:ribonuclease HII